MSRMDQPSSEAIINHLNFLKLSDDFQECVSAIVPGKVVRKPENEVYQKRLKYTHELRVFVYNPVFMNIILATPDLKELFFRTFGYMGNLEFTMYPNAWIRDLPLLEIGKKCYLADGILLGTNRVSIDQKILRVDHIKIGDHTIFDQHCAIGPGSTIGNDCIMGFQSQISAKCTIGNNVRLGEVVTIGSMSEIGDDVMIGQGSFISDFVTIEAGAEIDYHTRIPPKTHVTKEGKIEPK